MLIKHLGDHDQEASFSGERVVRVRASTASRATIFASGEAPTASRPRSAAPITGGSPTTSSLACGAYAARRRDTLHQQRMPGGEHALRAPHRSADREDWSWSRVARASKQHLFRQPLHHRRSRSVACRSDPQQYRHQLMEPTARHLTEVQCRGHIHNRCRAELLHDAFA